MSILSMADARVARQRAARQPVPRALPDGMPPPQLEVPDRARALELPGVPGEGRGDKPVDHGDDGFQGNANQLVRYVPTEILGAYVMFIGLLSPLTGSCKANFSSQWHAYIAFVVATPVVQYLVYRARARQAGELLQWPIAECVISTIAFAGWAAALPGSPLLDWCSWKPEYGVFAAAAIAVAIVLVANAFDLGLRTKPDYPEEVTGSG